MSVVINMVEKPGRTASTIQFPYTDMGDAIQVAEALMKGGGLPMSRDQLAAVMDAAPGSGSFNTKLGTARAFGVMETVAGKYQLTDLGYETIDPARKQNAMVNAFLNVELYKRTYDEFRGKLLPPRPLGLENAFVQFGVSPKQKDRARQAFDRSARMAGFFPNGNEDRLVMPLPGVIVSDPDERQTASENRNQAAPMPVPAPAPAAAQSKALEYELVDLLKTEGISDAESEAIWTLVRFLTARKKAPAA